MRYLGSSRIVSDVYIYLMMCRKCLIRKSPQPADPSQALHLCTCQQQSLFIRRPPYRGNDILYFHRRGHCMFRFLSQERRMLFFFNFLKCVKVSQNTILFVLNIVKTEVNMFRNKYVVEINQPFSSFYYCTPSL